MKIFRIDWFRCSGQGESLDQIEFYYANDETEVRTKLGLPLKGTGYESYDSKTKRLFEISELIAKTLP